MSTYLQRTKALVFSLALAMVVALGLAIAPQAYAAEGGDSGLAAGKAGLSAQRGESATIAEGTYNLPFLSSSLGMFKADATTASMEVASDSVTITFMDTGSADRFDKMALGKSSDLLPNGNSENLSGEAVIIEGVEKTVSGKTAYEYSIKMKKEQFAALSASEGRIYYTLHYVENYKDAKYANKWYKPSSDSYLILDSDFETIEKKKYETRLSITNEEKMFKGVHAFLSSDKKTLNLAMSGTGYSKLFTGTATEANAAAESDERFGKLTQNAVVYSKYTDYQNKLQNEGYLAKYQFALPVTLSEEGATTIPLAAYSTSQKIYTERRLVIDPAEKTLTIGNYESTTDVTVKSVSTGFNVNSKGTLYVKGYMESDSETSNEYTCTPTITMADDTYSKAFVGTAAEAASAADTIAITSDKKFTIPLVNVYGGTRQIDDGKNATVSFFNKNTSKWIEQKLVIDRKANTVTIQGASVEKPVAVTGLTYTGKEQTGVAAGTGYTVTGNTAMNVGSYTATAKLAEGYAWADGTTADVSIAWAITPAQIQVPAAATNLVYNGKAQTGVAAGEGYTVKDNTATNAGTYTATLTTDANHVFADGKTTATVKFTIAKAASTIKLTAKQSVTFNGKACSYPAKKVKKTGSTGKVTFAYYSDSKCTKSIKASKVKNAGVYYVKAKVAADANYKAATSPAVKFTINKKANTLKVKRVKATQTVKYNAKKNMPIAAKKVFKVTKNASKGKVSYKLTAVSKKAKGKITVSKAGKVTVKAGLAKGTYTVKVKATSKATTNYKAANKAVTFKVKVK